MTSDRVAPADLTEHPDDPCACGHHRAGHIYNEGACRIGGVICPCTEFRDANPKHMVKITRADVDGLLPPSFSPEQMERLLDAKSPGWRDDLPKLEWMPEGDPYWKQRAFELGQELLDLRLEHARIRGLFLGCDCGIIHDAYNEQRGMIVQLQEEVRRLQP